MQQPVEQSRVFHRELHEALIAGLFRLEQIEAEPIRPAFLAQFVMQFDEDAPPSIWPRRT